MFWRVIIIEATCPAHKPWPGQSNSLQLIIFFWNEQIDSQYITLYTCHISGEIKSHRLWPTWKPFLIRLLKFHNIYRPSYNTFYEEINIHHTLLRLSQASNIKAKAFDYLGEGSFKVMFVKISEFYQIALRNVPYLTDFSPQLMECMIVF